MGRVRIDASARVMDLDRHPMPGLFAAGEAARGMHGACGLGNFAITDWLVFGRTDSRNAATLWMGGSETPILAELSARG